MLVIVGMTMIGTIKANDRQRTGIEGIAPVEAFDFVLQKEGGSSPTNSPQHPIMRAIRSLLVKLSTDAIHHRHAALPSIRRPRAKSAATTDDENTSSETSRLAIVTVAGSEDPAGHLTGIIAKLDQIFRHQRQHRQKLHQQQHATRTSQDVRANAENSAEVFVGT